MGSGGHSIMAKPLILSPGHTQIPIHTLSLFPQEARRRRVSEQPRGLQSTFPLSTPLGDHVLASGPGRVAPA